MLCENLGRLNVRSDGRGCRFGCVVVVVAGLTLLLRDFATTRLVAERLALGLDWAGLGWPGLAGLAGWA